MWNVDFPTLRKSKKQPTSILSGIYHLAFTSSLHASSCNITYNNKSIWLRFFYLDDFTFYNFVFYSPGNCLADTCALVKPSRKTCLRGSEADFFWLFTKLPSQINTRLNEAIGICEAIMAISGNAVGANINQKGWNVGLLKKVGAFLKSPRCDPKCLPEETLNSRLLIRTIKWCTHCTFPCQ